jgi:hypothetical protein
VGINNSQEKALAQNCLTRLNADFDMATIQEKISLASLSQLLGKPVTTQALTSSRARASNNAQAHFRRLERCAQRT